MNTYQFRPAWMSWTFPHNSKQHKPWFNDNCFGCRMPGHFARTCTVRKAQKSKSNQVRGKSRIQEFSQQKQLLKELPFYNVRNSALRNLIDYSAVLKHELAQTKQSLKDSQDNFLELIAQFNEM